MSSPERNNRLILFAIGAFVIVFGGLMVWLGMRWGRLETLGLERVPPQAAGQDVGRTAGGRTDRSGPTNGALPSPQGPAPSAPAVRSVFRQPARPETQTLPGTGDSTAAPSGAAGRTASELLRSHSAPKGPTGAASTGVTASPIVKKSLQTFVLVVLAYALMFFLINLINRHVRDVRQRHGLRKNIVYAINFMLVAGVLLIWLQNIGYLTILLGFASAGLALALQEVILCVAGWLMILIRRPFDTGDRIEINGVRGDVIDIRLFQTSLLEIGNWVDADQSTGRIVNIPNSFVFKHPNFNYNRGFDFIWNEIPVLVTFESDWKKAHDIILRHGREYAAGLEEEVKRKLELMKNRYMIYYGKLSPIVYVNIKDSGVELTLRYLTEAKKRRSSQDRICRGILQDFAEEPTVDFAYPTYRIVR